MTEMEKQFVDYLHSLEMSQIAIDRANMIYQFFTDVCKVKIADIFVADYVDKENKRIFDNLWFFNENIMIEAHDFISTDRYDMTSSRNYVDRWEIIKRDYDFKTPLRESRLTLIVDIRHESISGTLRATWNNCSQLLKIFEKYILPNIRV